MVDAGLAWLAVIGALFSLVSAFFYLRVIVFMYMRDFEQEEEKTDGKSWDLSLGLGIAAAGVLLLGILRRRCWTPPRTP